MARMSLFVPPQMYAKLMQGFRVCRVCNEYFKKHKMTYVEDVGLVCATCHPKVEVTS